MQQENQLSTVALHECVHYKIVRVFSCVEVEASIDVAENCLLLLQFDRVVLFQ